MVLFGGMSPITGDTHAYDIERQLWRKLAPETKDPVPAARCHHTFVGVPERDQGLLFGGFSFFGRFNDTWVFDARTERWTPLETIDLAPARRCLHSAVYLPSRDAMLVFGGIKGNGVAANDFFEDTHILTLADSQWQRIDAAGPGKRAGAFLFHATAEDAVYLWGGRQVATYPQDLWRFDLSRLVWEVEETTGPIPLGREDPSVFWDADRSALWMFSGRNDSTPDVLLDDAYSLDHPGVPDTGRALKDDPVVDLGAFEFALPGDADFDFDVDLADYLAFVSCMSRPGAPPNEGCHPADLDLDTDVDLADLIRLQAAFTGPR